MWTSTKIRWRDNAYIKVKGHWLHWLFKPPYSYQVIVHDPEVKAWLSYTRRGEDWRVSANGQDISEWFESNGKGLIRYIVYPSGDGLWKFAPDMEVEFTDKHTALMFKLAFGGR